MEHVPTTPALAGAGIRTLTIPKPSGGTRTLTILARDQARRYAHAVAAVARRTDTHLGQQVFSDRLTRSGDHETWRPAFRRFVDRTRELRASLAGPIVALDVARCFESISPPVVESALLHAGCHPSEVRPIRGELESLAQVGVTGLPVGPRASATLAGVVLGVIDRVFADAGVPHARWVDDVIAFPGTEAAGRRLLEEVQASLASIGLRLHPGKSEVCEDDALRAPSLSSAVRRGVSSARR